MSRDHSMQIKLGVQYHRKMKEIFEKNLCCLCMRLASEYSFTVLLFYQYFPQYLQFCDSLIKYNIYSL